MEYKEPDKENLQSIYKIAFKEEFLKLNNLKVGDEIEMEFPYEQLNSRYKKKGQDRSTHRKMAKGILKQDEYGFLYAESFENFSFYTYAHNSGIGRHFKEWYDHERKPSIIKFGTGFIY